MKVPARLLISPALALILLSNNSASAQENASTTDNAFVGKVSQGGRYEVEASKLALQKASAQDVKDLADSEVHDHELVNQKLKSISISKGVPIAPALNSDFQQKLDHLKALSGNDFDAAYLSEMNAIHYKDEMLFAQEATAGGATDYKAFAAQTDLIVKRHIGALHGTDQR